MLRRVGWDGKWGKKRVLTSQGLRPPAPSEQCPGIVSSATHVCLRLAWKLLVDSCRQEARSLQSGQGGLEPSADLR